MKVALVKMGIRVRRRVFKRIAWAYDVDNDGKLDESEIAALKAAIRERFEKVPPAE